MPRLHRSRLSHDRLAAAALVLTGCGKKVASIGKLQAYDKATKSITIQVTQSSDSKQVKKSIKLTLTPGSKTIGKTTIDKLVGKSLSVVSEHNKVDLVIPLVASK